MVTEQQTSKVQKEVDGTEAEKHKVSAADQLYREQVDEFNVSCEVHLLP